MFHSDQIIAKSKTPSTIPVRYTGRGWAVVQRNFNRRGRGRGGRLEGGGEYKEKYVAIYQMAIKIDIRSTLNQQF